MMPIDDAPHVGGNNEFRDELNIREWRRFPDVSGDERLYGTLIDAIGAMTTSSRDADEIYAAAIRRPRDDEEFVVLVLRTLDQLEESAYQERWALLQLAIDLEHPLTGRYLVDFVRRPIPEERAEDPVHGVSTVTEEVILRTTAIEGLARLFRRDFDSTDVLLETVESSDYVAMRRAAWFALIDGGRDDAVQRARELLHRSDFGWIADLRRIPVEEAEQQNPRLIDPNRAPRGDIPAPFDE
jgi:hypothetical protein